MDAIPPNILLPKLPSYVQVGFRKDAGKKKKATKLPTGITEEMMDRGRQVAEHLTHILHNKKFETEKAGDAYFDMMRQMICNMPGTRIGPYNGHALMLRKSSPGAAGTIIQFGVTFLEDLPPKAGPRDPKLPMPKQGRDRDHLRIPPVLLVSNAYYWFSLCQDAGIQALQEIGEPGKDLKHVIRRVCEVADLVNSQIRDGEPIPTTCHHDEHTSQSAMESCQACGRIGLCADLKYSQMYRARVCARCRTIEGELPTMSRVWSLFRRLVRRDLELLGDLPMLNLVLQSIVDALPDQAKIKARPVVIHDTYFQHVERREVNPDTRASAAPAWQQGSKGGIRRAGDASQISVDKIMPMLIDENGNRVLHGKNNVALTALWVNFAKHEWPIAVAAIARDLMVETEKQHPSRSEITRHIRRMDDIHEVVLKWVHSTATKVKQNINPGLFRIRQQEWVSGKPCPTTSKDQKKKICPSIPKCPPRWTVDDRVKKLAQSIVDSAAKRGVTLARGRDDAPYPGDPDSMPDDWDWWQCWVFFSERLWRMWLYCNCRWILVDVVETIYRKFFCYICGQEV